MKSPSEVLSNMTRRLKPGWKLLAPWGIANPELMNSTPSHCLLPGEAFVDAMATSGIAQDPDDLSINSAEADVFMVLGLWRLSKGVYKVSPDLLGEVRSSGLPSTIPTDVLLRLPEWAIYIDLKGLGVYHDGDVDGAWVCAEHRQSTGADRLLVLAVRYDDPGTRGMTILQSTLDMSVSDFDEMVNTLSDDELRVAETYGLGKTREPCPSRKALLDIIIKILLYICSSEPDIEDRDEPDVKPSRAHMQRIGKRDMFVAADRVRVWNVGDRVGEVIRNYNEQPKDRKHTRRHLRRAHWHGYWTGKRGSDEREFSYKWLSPMVVGVSP